MERTVRKGIIHIISNHTKLLRIPLRQKAKFEGWLKFELAHYLEDIGLKNIEVESKAENNHDRTDITLLHNGELYKIELKTPNTNWKINGVNSNGRPITMNIDSVIADAMKLNSANGIVAFVLFPVPLGDNRWKSYLDRINEKTGFCLSKENSCDLIDIQIDEENKCSLVVCTFRSKRFRDMFGFRV